MNNSSNSYNLLLLKLDEFIRKYYKNQLIRGGLYTTGLVITLFLTISILEYFGRFDTLVRSILFWSFLATTGYVLTRFIALPVFRLNKIGKTITHAEAAAIIGKHFGSVQDKLLNVLQLQQSEQPSGISADLLQASIDQKIAELKPIPFAAAVDLTENKRYIKYAAIPVLLMLAIVFTNSRLITESSRRLINHTEYFEEEAPFIFSITNAKLETEENKDFELNVKLKGEEIPDVVYLMVDDNEYRLTKNGTIDFSFLFRKVQQNKKFRFKADGFLSREYTLNVLPSPMVLNFDVALEYPAYLKRVNETIKNTGDLIVPAGTKVKWLFNTKSTKNLTLKLGDSLYKLNPSEDNKFAFSRKMMGSSAYTIVTSNEYVKSSDSIKYHINVTPDLYPTIALEEKRDSISRLRLYFTGEVKDDYGFNRMQFVFVRQSYKDTLGNTIPERVTTVPIPLSKQSNRENYYYYWDLSNLGIAPGEQLSYYFEVWDNDGVNGPKSTRTQQMVYKAPTEKELQEQFEANNQQIEQKLEESLAESKALQKEINDLNKKIMEKKNTTWEDKQKMKELTARQQALQQKIDELKQMNAANQAQQQEFQNDPQTQAKQEEMNELFNQLSAEEMKKMLEDIQKMIDNSNKEKTQQDLDQMKQSNEDMQKDLDRTLELFRQMQVEMKMDNLIQKLDNLQQRQDSLSKLTEQKGADNKEMKAAQDSLNKEFDQLRKEMDELSEMNQKLENPNDIPNTDVQEMQIQQQQREASQNLNQGGNKKGAAKNQKSAADQMKEMSDQMKQARAQMQQDQQEEDLQAIRQLLDNLIKLSFDQEALMVKVKNTGVNDPQYPALAKEQKRLQDDSKVIEDSLLALSKRNPMLSPLVNKEITAIKYNMGRSKTALNERTPGEAQYRQQLAMTSINNLALLLNESLESAMQQMNQQGKNPSECKGGNCKKPGQGQKSKPGVSQLMQMQKGINGKMQQMQNGTIPMNAEELAKMAAQQEFIRRAMQEALKNSPNQGGGPGGDIPSKMEQTEQDLVNKQINAETIQRQQEILDKMLEFEKAEKEKEQDDQRQSNEAKDYNLSNPSGFFEYNRQKQREAELLRTVPPALSPYYRSKVSTYFNGVNQ